MSAGEIHSTFIRRFNRIWAQARRVQLSQALCWTILVVLTGLSLLAAADYFLELSRLVRTGAVTAIGMAAIVVAVVLCVQSFRRWQRQATAATIEHVFPQLGQRIRTTVQCAELTPAQIADAGLAQTLVTALDHDTVRRAEPLPLDAVVPWKSLALASLSAAALGLGLAGASALNWEWRAAARRAFLGEQPYTQIFVEPGDATVQEGESLLVQLKVQGRTGSHITFQSRRTDEQGSPWRDEKLTVDQASRTADREVSLEIPLDRIRHPLEYRVLAGSSETPVYRVTVLYPLAIVRQQTTIQPPEYTRLPLATSEGGDVTALVGSHLALQIELDREPLAAWLDMQSLARRFPGEEPVIVRVPLVIEGAKLTAELDLASDQTYAIVAQAADDMELPPNKFRLRARPDEPPHVSFDNPSESIEVHTLAEVFMRIRASDDFGLSRAGIMFEVNNEEEYPLLAKDFEEAARELQTTGALSRETRATLEKVLPLEHFQLSQQDSVMYYAFAEDIKPGQAQRTETDLRFIDIRPFRRNYRELDLPDGQGQGRQFKGLEEIIARQRYALNQTIQLDRKHKHSGQPDLPATDALIKFEGELAQATRDYAEGLLQRGIDETELLFQAETAMLAAADSLSAGNYDTATLQMREALKYLIEGRNRLEIAFFKNRNRQMLAALRAFDRLQRQKLRRPKSDEDAAAQIAQRLEELAQAEDSLFAGPLPSPMPSPVAGPAPSPSTPPSQPAASAASTSPSPSTAPAPSPPSSQPGSGQGLASNSTPSDPSSPPQGGSAASGVPSREDLEDRQLGIAAEARAIEQALAQLPKATDLAKERMAGAAKQAEDAAEAASRGALDEAKSAAGLARDQFRELAGQVKALLAREQANRIAAAQQMAEDLAREQQQFVDRLAMQDQNPGSGNQPRQDQQPMPGTGSGKQAPQPDQPMRGLGGMARDLAEKAKTLADVLGSASKPAAPADQKTADEVARIMKAVDLKGVTDRLAELPAQIEGRKFVDARATAGDGAERMESAAEQLGALHRAIVAPKVDELAKLEQNVAQLDNQLDKLDTDPRVTTWHVAADDLLAQLDDLGIDKELQTEFREEMRKAGWGGDRARSNWAWGRNTGGTYAAPARYRMLLARVADSLRARMQEYLLGDMQATGDEPIPPQYQDLVDRYYRVLAAEGKVWPRSRAADSASGMKNK
jgi:hypothetical protein